MFFEFLVAGSWNVVLFIFVDALRKFLATFQARDWITLTASVAALAMSLLSFRQKNTEGRQSLRKQLTDVLQNLSDLNIEIAKFESLTKKDGYPSHYPRLINDQRRFLAQQASDLSKRIQDLVTPVKGTSHHEVLIALTTLNKPTISFV